MIKKAQKLQSLQNYLRQYQNKLKSMAAEINMLNAQKNEYEQKIKRGTEDIEDIQNSFYQKKKKEILIQRELQNYNKLKEIKKI